MERVPVKKTVRFEVFKRDSFTCQYCGQKAPDVVLEVDHITPVAGGGDNDILNLVTACKSCNAGKSARPLSSSDAIEKRRAQLEELEERRQQLKMLHEWHMSLIDLNDQSVDMAQSLWFESIGEPGATWTQPARDEIRKLIAKNGFDVVCTGVRKAADCALRASKIAADREGVMNKWFWKIGGVIEVEKREQADPGVKKLYYIKGIIRNRCGYVNDGLCMSLLHEARDTGISVEWLERIAKLVTSWTQFRNFVTEELNEGPQRQCRDAPSP